MKNKKTFYSKEYRSNTSPALASSITPDKILTRYALFYDLRSGNPDEVILDPFRPGDADRLNMYARKLMIENPSIEFNRLAKAGKFNNMSDDDYTEATRKITKLSKEVFGNAPLLNLFEALASITKLALSAPADKPEGLSVTGNAVSVQRFLDNNHIHGADRCSFYEFLSHKLEVGDMSQPDTFVDVSIDGAPMTYHIPKDDYTLYLFTKEKVFIVTLYDPTYNWILRDGSVSDEGELDAGFIDIRMLLSGIGFDVSDDEVETLEDTVVLQKPDIYSAGKLLSMLEGREIELYYYDIQPEYDALYREGRLMPVSAAKAEDGRDAIVFKRINTDTTIHPDTDINERRA